MTTTTQNAKDLKQGDVIIFTTTPIASYLRTHVRYKVVQVGRYSICFENLESGSGTHENTVLMNRTAQWVVTGAKR